LPAALVALALSGRGLWKVIAVIGIVGWAQTRGWCTRAWSPSASRIRSRRDPGRSVATAGCVPAPAAERAGAAAGADLGGYSPRGGGGGIAVVLGLGVAVTTPSLGLRVAQGYQYLFSGSWWPSVLPGVALVLLVLSENLIGDWVRDVLDPRSRGRGRVVRSAAAGGDRSVPGAAGWGIEGAPLDGWPSGLRQRS